MTARESAPNHNHPEVEQLLEYYELLHATLHELGKSARTLVTFDEADAVIKNVHTKSFLLPGALTEWVPSERSNLPNGLAINRERRFAAGLFQLGDGKNKLVVDAMDSMRHRRPVEAGGSDEYHTQQLRYRFVWDAEGAVLQAEMRPVDIYSSTELTGWSGSKAMASVTDGAGEPFRFDHGWQQAGAGDVDQLLFRTDEFRQGLAEQREADVA